MASVRIALFCMLFFVFATPSIKAQGTVKLTGAAPGAKAGEIVITGSITVDAGWKFKSSVTTAWLTGGGTPIQFLNTPAASGAFTVTLAGLTSGAEYWVSVQPTFTSGPLGVTLISDPLKSKAK